MEIQTEYFDRSIRTLREALKALDSADPESIHYDLYRAASVKTFEISLELGGKLLRKALKPYFATPKEVDRLVFKDVFRHAVKHGILDTSAVTRWMDYRDNRNTTAHDYGEGFANSTLKLLPQFLADAEELSRVLKTC
jgi:nucleotidyltransferase substrate binding protein (TIGR01987 family)